MIFLNIFGRFIYVKNWPKWNIKSDFDFLYRARNTKGSEMKYMAPITLHSLPIQSILYVLYSVY